MFEAFCKEKLAPLTLRLALGLVCVYHGFSKIMMTGGLDWNRALPPGWQLAVAWGEFGSGVAILLGLYCRLAALAVLVLIVGNLAYFHGGRVFQLPLRSLEYTVLLLLVGLTLLLLGAGELSLDGRGAGGKTPAAGKGTGKKRAAA
jgi:putative oxidoreductase